MEYFVIAGDGEKYGPADLALLHVWGIEGRIAPLTEIEEAISGKRISAKDLPGLNLPDRGDSTTTQNVPGQDPTAISGYHRGPSIAEKQQLAEGYVKRARNFGWWAIAINLLMLCFCPISMVIGIVFGAEGLKAANCAGQLGHPEAEKVRTLNIVAIILNTVLALAVIGFYGFDAFGL